MMYRRLIIACLLGPAPVMAQTGSDARSDTLKTTQLDEVVIISQKNLSEKAAKPLSTLENYLEKASAVNMVRRGNYAWEPFLNGMASERSVITIDGMRIYAACTDKMDPVTSYVEITNLAKANVHSGQSGSTGATIAGSLDLVRKKSFFDEERTFGGTAFAGFEANNRQKIAGSTLSYSGPGFFTDVDFTFRDAGNYKAGGGEEILYSQFTKYNVSAIAGYKMDEHQHIEASVIYDHALNVGYPALPMDVALAKAFIGSVEYVRHHVSPSITQWQTKLYYNDVTHVMDDSRRPLVPVRMDMPGWSTTAGFYSLLQGDKGRHSWKANVSGHHNRSLAEMTMYANTPGTKDMFMLTWPGVHTSYGDVFAGDIYPLSQRWKMNVSAGLAVHNNRIDNLLGLESLKIFYPALQRSRTRLLKRAAASFQYERAQWLYNFGLAYGDRAPGVSEGYGFYLFNSFDRFDYIGNPGMKNEKSASLNGGVSYRQPGLSTKLSASYFYLADYIIGRPQPGLSAMTIGAAGVKVYEQLKYARILNASADVRYQLSDHWLWSNRLSYRAGTGEKVGNLPLMQPLIWGSEMMYSVKSFTADVSVNGAAGQGRFNPGFGESALPAYLVIHLSASNRFKLGKQSLLLKAGVENLLDRSYTTFSDWNRLPRTGRNFYLNVVYGF